MAIAEQTTVIELPEDCPATQYHSHEGISNSKLKILRRSPRKFRAMFIDKTLEQETTEAMEIGTLTHLAYLESHRIEEHVRIIPESVLSSSGTTNTNACRAFVAENAGYHCIKTDKLKAIQSIAASLLEVEAARTVIEASGHIEHTICWEDADTGIACKARIDKWIPHANMVIDLKTCEDCRPWKFERDADKFKYYQQAAIYTAGIEAITGQRPKFVFIVVEKKPPYDVAFHEVDADWLAYGESQFQGGLVELRRRLDENDWLASWQKKINTLHKPKFSHDED